MLGVPADELPVDVFTELGRVTWAAIKLEDYTKGVCSTVEPRNPRTDKPQISTWIRGAKRVLGTWPEGALAREATAWMERARLAIERRNAVLHATPMAWIDPDRRGQLFLAEMPRRGRPYTERPLTVESLAELRSVLESASAGWLELITDIADAKYSGL
jgi:hypothetical protein